MKLEQEYTLVEHLTELRKRLIIVAVTFIISLAIGFGIAPKILTFIKMQPTARHVEWNVFGYTDGLMIYVKCALLLAILITLPIALYQTWLFVKPGMSRDEKEQSCLFRPLFYCFWRGSVLVIFSSSL